MIPLLISNAFFNTVAGVALGLGGTAFVNRFQKRRQRSGRLERIRSVNPRLDRPPLDALAEYKEIRKEFAGQDDPESAAEIGFRMARECLKLGIDSRSESHLSDAIRYVHSSLETTSPDADPIRYADLQSSLGSAHSGLAEIRDRHENLTKAAAALQIALEIRQAPRYKDLREAAKLQLNLGNVYNRWADGEELVRNCRRATQAYEKALEHVDRRNDPELWSRAQGNLAAVLLTLAYAENRASNSRRSIDLSREIIESKVQDYNWTLLNAAAAHVLLGEAEKNAQEFREALSTCDLATGLFDCVGSAPDCATIQHIKGTAFTGLALFENPDRNLANAITALETALETRTVRERPSEYADTCLALAEAIMQRARTGPDAQDFQNALIVAARAWGAAAREEGNIIVRAELLRVQGESYLAIGEMQKAPSECDKALKALDEARQICAKETLTLPLARLDGLLVAARETCKRIQAQVPGSPGQP